MDLASKGRGPDVSNRNQSTSDLVTPLCARERTALARCERVIAKGAAQFVAVGLALKEIRDGRLYREAHSSFEAYCLDKFSFRRAHGYRLIEQATAVVELEGLCPEGDVPLPQNEGQARELAAVLSETRAEVMRLASEKAGGRFLTAKLIRDAAVELGAIKPPNGKLIPNGGDDCVQTPDWLASAIVDHFRPSGRVLDPCRGRGAFFRAFPTHCQSEWCEIEDGRDFYAVKGHWDWVVGNPPYSEFRRFLAKAMEVGDNVVFLSLANAWWIRARQQDIRKAGFGLVELHEVPVPKKEDDWPQFGMSLVAAWLRRGWEGGIACTRFKHERAGLH
jgi:hypothetical protein